MIPNEEKWYCLAVKTLSFLFRGTTSKHHCDFYCLDCLHSLATENKRDSHKKARENKDFCNVYMPSEDTKTLEFNQYQKFNKGPFIIYRDIECTTEKIDGFKNNPENLSTTKVSEHISLGFLMSTIVLFRSIENKHESYRGEDCMKSFVNP